MLHKYKMNGLNLVLDVNSGGVFVFDDCSYDMLDFLDDNLTEEMPKELLRELSDKGYSNEEIRESYSEIYELYTNGSLFSKADDYEVLKNIDNNVPLKAMCLNVAHDCNLKCEYCFAAKGNFGGEPMLMPFEVGKSAIDFLIEKSGHRRNLEVDFFGGEPLLNFEVVKKIVKYARSREKEFNKNFRFTITTNGLLLTDDKIEYINSEMSNCVLSLDGRKEVNDKLRMRCDGSGSYDSIVPKFLKLVQNRSKDRDYYVRGTFTKNNLDFSQDVLHMNSLGFDQISVEPVVSDPKLEYSINEEDLPIICDEYKNLAKKMLSMKQQGRGFNFFHFMVDLEQGPCAIKRLRGCGCGNEYVAITPEGDIYPCHQFVGMDEWKMGNLLQSTFDKEKKEYFSKANIYNKEKCNDCWAKFYCSGGCNANNLSYAGDVFKPLKLSCDLMKKRLECAIMMKAACAD